MRRSFSVVGLAVLVVLLAGCNLLDWPQYGANGANTGRVATSPINTSTVGSLQQAWEVSSPNSPATLAVTDDTVYASSALGQPTVSLSPPLFIPPPPPLEARSVTDGSLRWSAGTLTESSESDATCTTSIAGTDPVVTNGTYYDLTQNEECVSAGAGVHSCADATIDVATGVSGTLTDNPDGCISSDPVAASDGTVYVVRTPNPLTGGGPNGFFPAVIGSDGSVFIVPGMTAITDTLSTPAVDGNSLFVTADVSNGTGLLVAFDRTTHQVLWSHALGNVAGTATPSVANGRVYVATPTNTSTTSAAAFNEATGQPLWSDALPQRTSTPALADGGGAIFLNTGATLLALNAATGATLWQSTLGPAPDLTAGPPSVANDVVFVGTDDGRLLAFNATGNGCSATAGCTPIWSATLSGATDTSRPAISGDAVYISAQNGTATSSNLYKFSLSGH
jgi:outer membrane protein assembly factor BamB